MNRFRRVLSAQGGGTLEDLSAGEEVDDALEDVFALVATNGPAAAGEVPGEGGRRELAVQPGASGPGSGRPGGCGGGRRA